MSILPGPAALPATMSQAEYARHRGLSRNAVHKAVHGGRIPVGPDGRIDPDAADRAWTANTDPSKRGDHVPARPALPAGLEGAPASGLSSDRLPAGMTYADARALREWNQALLLEQQRRQRSGDLVERVEIVDLVFTATRAARDLLRAVEDRLSPLMIGQTDMEVVRKLIREEHDRVCDELSKAAPLDVEPDRASA